MYGNFIVNFFLFDLILDFLSLSLSGLASEQLRLCAHFNLFRLFLVFDPRIVALALAKFSQRSFWRRLPIIRKVISVL